MAPTNVCTFNSGAIAKLTTNATATKNPFLEERVNADRAETMMMSIVITTRNHLLTLLYS